MISAIIFAYSMIQFISACYFGICENYSIKLFREDWNKATIIGKIIIVSLFIFFIPATIASYLLLLMSRILDVIIKRVKYHLGEDNEDSETVK